MVFYLNIGLYLFSFFLIWYASGVIIDSISRFTERLKLSAFAVSFFVLGILTSIPEFSVGINSIIEKRPGIFVGNLLGASLILFILIIPLLAVLGNGVKMRHNLSTDNLIFSLLVVAAPVFLIADNVLTRTESVFLIVMYAVLIYFIEKRNGLLLDVRGELESFKDKHVVEDILELLLASVLVYFSSKIIVDETVYFSQVFSVSSFLISLVVLSIGTNLPELMLAIRSVMAGKREVALGDYLGSAAANTLLFGIFTLLNGARINVESYSYKTMAMMLIGLGIFYVFSRSKQEISRLEGKILLLVYAVFLAVEIFVH